MTAAVLLPNTGIIDAMSGLPDGIRGIIWHPDDYGQDLSEIEVYVPPFELTGAALSLPERMPNLRLVQLLTAGADRWVGTLPGGVQLCSARGAHDGVVSEWIVAVLLMMFRELRVFTEFQRRREWSHRVSGSLIGKTVLILGYGSIGRALAARLDVLGATTLRVARQARPPEAVYGIESLDGLLASADVLVILLPLTPQTRGMVDSKMLARLSDSAIVVNAARGAIVDTEALTWQVKRGRLRAVLDVTEPEPLAREHELWRQPGAFITPHVAGSTPLAIGNASALLRYQLERWIAGAPLQNMVGAKGY